MNEIILLGTVIGKYRIPSLNLNAIKFLYDEKEEITVYLPRELHDLLELNGEKIGIKGLLYNFEGKTRYLYANSIFTIGA